MAKTKATTYKKWGPFSTYTEVLTEKGVAGVRALHIGQWVEGVDHNNKPDVKWVQTECSKTERKRLFKELEDARKDGSATAGVAGGYRADLGTGHVPEPEE